MQLAAAQADLAAAIDTIAALALQERDHQAEAEQMRTALQEAQAALVLAAQATADQEAAAQTARGEYTVTLAEVRDQLRTAQAGRESCAAEAETLRTELAQARADIATELDRAKTQRGVLLAAMRSLFVDVSKRLLQKEVDRARKNQTTPDKLRAWVATFYPMHAITCRAAFQPLIGPWTAIAGGDGEALLDRLVSEHVATSQRALALVLDVEDGEELAGALERTLMRWEQERADQMADALIREGMTS
jgi:hypothetical protein